MCDSCWRLDAAEDKEEEQPVSHKEGRTRSERLKVKAKEGGGLLCGSWRRWGRQGCGWRRIARSIVPVVSDS